MNRLLLSLFFIPVVSCRSAESSARPYKDFEFYYAGTFSQVFSIRFTQGDTVYLRQYFASNHYLKGNLLKAHTSYVSTLTPEVRNKLDSSIRHIDFEQYDTSYYDDNLQDGTDYGFYIETDSLSKAIHIYGDDAPNELLYFGRSIVETKNNLPLVKINTPVTFKRAMDWWIPTPKVHIEKFTPPNFE
jgi:hypothetical protein